MSDLDTAAEDVGIVALDGSEADLHYARSLERSLGRVEFRHFPYPPTWTVEPIGLGQIAVTVTYRVPDRNTGEPMLVREGQSFWMRPMTAGDIVRMARDVVRKFVLHEVDEALRLGDARPFDPHRDDR